MPPPDLSWGPRQCVWAIKSGKRVVTSPCKVLACVLTSLMVNAVGVESSRDDPSEGGQVLVGKNMCHFLTLVWVPDNMSGPLKVAKKL